MTAIDQLTNDHEPIASATSGGAIVGDRDNQQDAWAIMQFSEGNKREPGGELLILADGMGGHVGGAEASRIVVDTVAESFAANSTDRVAIRLRKATDEANAALASAIAESPDLKGMGSTLIAAAHQHNGTVQWISVGDSLLLEVGANAIQRLNADHSLGASIDKQVEEGKLSHEEAARHPDRNVLQSALTGRSIALIDEGSARLRPGHLLMLASDGIETLKLDDISAMARDANDSEDLIQSIFNRIEKDMTPDQDNTTIIAAPGSKGSVGAQSKKHRRNGNTLLYSILGAIGFAAIIAASTLLIFSDDNFDTESATVSRPATTGIGSEVTNDSGNSNVPVRQETNRDSTGIDIDGLKSANEVNPVKRVPASQTTQQKRTKKRPKTIQKAIKPVPSTAPSDKNADGASGNPVETDDKTNPNSNESIDGADDNPSGTLDTKIKPAPIEPLADKPDGIDTPSPDGGSLE